MATDKKVDRKAIGYEFPIPTTLFVSVGLDYSQVGTEAEQIACMMKDYYDCVQFYQDLHESATATLKLLDHWLIYHAHVILKIDLHHKHGGDPVV